MFCKTFCKIFFQIYLHISNQRITFTSSIGTNMIEVELTNRMIAFVDDEDYHLVCNQNWYAFKDKNTYYAINKNRVKMHKLIIPNSSIIDHEDGNGLNNQKCNLRACTFNQNNANRKPWKNKSSKYLGVYKIGNKYRAASRCNGILKTAGEFKTENEAALAYNKLAVKHHGDFAKLNIITNF